MRTRLSIAVITVVITTASLTAAQSRRTKRSITVGIVVDGSLEGERILLDEMKSQLSELAGDSFSVQFPANKMSAGDFEPAKIRIALDRMLADPGVDLIWTFGVLASNDAARRKSLSRPVIAPFVFDRTAQKLPFKAGASGRRNLNYIDFPWSLERDLKLFKEVVGPRRMAFVIGKYLVDAQTEIGAGAVAQAANVGIQLTVVGAAGTAEQILASIPEGITAVYLGPLAQTSGAERRKLIAQLIRRKVAIYAAQGEIAVREGALLGRRPREALRRVARRVALNTMRIASGGDAGKLPVALSLPERLIINMKTARSIGISPSWSVLTEAELINSERTDASRRVSLASVTREALAGNVNVRALREVVAAGSARVRSARANLLPRIEATTSARVIDKDRAEGGFGGNPRLLWTGDITVNQVVWSEEAWAGFTAEKHVQRSRQAQLEQTRWDVVAEVGVAYLNVLRTKTAERITRNNLKLTRANLELARTRLDAGASSRSDVFRWEAQIANDRKAMIEASSTRNLTEMDLQRILHRPPEERFATDEGDLTSIRALDPNRGLFRFIGDPWTFRLFRKFMIERAITRSPEIRQFDAAIAAQRRLLVSARRAPYSPMVGVSSGFTRRLYKRGAGAEPPMGISGADDNDWFVALQVSLPLYTGGARYAEIDRNNAEVRRLSREREAVRDQIAQRAASHLHLMGASYAGIRLSREAATSARKNYDLVAGSYAQGAARIVELLDAQNAWVTADQVAADAVYNFLIDWINVQRAIGRFELISDAGELRQLVKDAQKFIAASKRAAP